MSFLVLHVLTYTPRGVTVKKVDDEFCAYTNTFICNFPDIFPYELADFGKGAKHPKPFIYCVRWFMLNTAHFCTSKAFIESLY
jgi:hypothetical protein